jgi:Tfp pilus assembly protein PilZ
MPEKRIAERTRKRVMVKYGTDKADRMGFTRNLSETGLFIGTNNVFRPGTTIQIQLKFPDREFSVWARVVWAKKVPSQLAHVLECGMGVCFVEPPPDWLEFFRAWKDGKS